MNNLNGLIEGDRIKVLTVAGTTSCGVFIRVENGFLIWVKDKSEASSYLTISSLSGLNISKL